MGEKTEPMSLEETEPVTGGGVNVQENESTFDLEKSCNGCGYRKITATLLNNESGKVTGTLVCPQCSRESQWGLKVGRNGMNGTFWYEAWG